MNVEMAYLLGMICGNGEIKRGSSDTIISIEIPHKVLKTSEHHDIQLYVKASISDIRSVLEPLIGVGLNFIQNKSVTILSFSKPNTDYLMREIMQYIGMATSHNDVKLHARIFDFTIDEKKLFLRGFADVTGYVRRSNYMVGSTKTLHRVYLEVPSNWYLVVDICNLLKDLNIPVQNINWGHPNMRDPNLKDYNKGKTSWKKEHQIKIFVNEFLPVGFSVIHKQQSLELLSAELCTDLNNDGKVISNKTGKFYWQGVSRKKTKPSHPHISDSFIPIEIKGKNFNSWKEIAKELGYHE